MVRAQTDNKQLPRYIAIGKQLKSQIQQGVYGLGERLPSNLVLAEVYSTSPQTIRQSLGYLQAEGWVQSTRGSGTFVKADVSPRQVMKIALVMPDCEHSHGLQLIINSITQEAAMINASVVLHIANLKPDTELVHIRTLSESDFSGAIVWPVITPEIVSALSELKKMNFPFVLVGNWIPGLDAEFVGVDDQQMGYLAGEHLLKQGYKDIAFLSESMQVASTVYPRLQGLRRALNENYMDIVGNRIFYVDHKLGYGPNADPFAPGYQKMKELILSGDLPDAIFAAHDYIAAGALNACLEMGVRVPGDIAIIGSGDEVFTRACRPQLSSVQFNYKMIGAKAIEVFTKLVENRLDESGHHLIGHGEVVARASTCNINKTY